MGAKRGVGLVVSFDAPGTLPLVADVASAPNLVEFYATDAESVPTTFEGWGAPLGPAAASLDPTTVTSAQPSSPVRHMLVVLQQLGPDAGCSDSNPFRGSITDLRLAG